MKQTKDLLTEFEKLELQKNELAEQYHNSQNKESHFHALDHIVMRQIDISNVLQARVECFNGNEKMRVSGLDLFEIIDHHLHLELGRIHAKDMTGLYDLVEDINENCLKEGIIVEYFLNLGHEKDFDKAINHLENNRQYSWVRPKLLGMAVTLSVAFSSVAKSVLSYD